MLSFINPIGISKNRERFIHSINKRVGKGNWFWVFKVGKKLYSNNLGMQLYEDAYWIYLKKNIDALKLIMNSNEIYIINRHDIESGLSYTQQNHPYQEHYADIAIRRCLRRYGTWFRGNELLSLVGSKLDDARIPFHLPHLVNSPDKTLRSWFNSSRAIVVAKTIEDEAKLSEILIR